jgi:hypothetical protein
MRIRLDQAREGNMRTTSLIRKPAKGGALTTAALKGAKLLQLKDRLKHPPMKKP